MYGEAPKARGVIKLFEGAADLVHETEMQADGNGETSTQIFRESKLVAACSNAFTDTWVRTQEL